MKRFLMQDVLKPAFRRVGSTMGGALLALGATAELASQTETVVTALMLFGADLYMSKQGRR